MLYAVRRSGRSRSRIRVSKYGSSNAAKKWSRAIFCRMANFFPGRRVPSDGRYPRAATTAYLHSHGDEFAVPSDTVPLEMSVQIAHVDVSPASCTRYNHRPLLPTAGWLHPHQADTEAELTCLHRPSCNNERKLETATETTQPMWCRRNVSVSPSAVHDFTSPHPTKTADDIFCSSIVDLDFVCWVTFRQRSHRLDHHSGLDDFGRTSSGLILAVIASTLTRSTREVFQLMTIAWTLVVKSE